MSEKTLKLISIDIVDEHKNSLIKSYGVDCYGTMCMMNPCCGEKCCEKDKCCCVGKEKKCCGCFNNCCDVEKYKKIYRNIGSITGNIIKISHKFSDEIELFEDEKDNLFGSVIYGKINEYIEEVTIKLKEYVIEKKDEYKLAEFHLEKYFDDIMKKRFNNLQLHCGRDLITYIYESALANNTNDKILITQLYTTSKFINKLINYIGFFDNFKMYYHILKAANLVIASDNATNIYLKKCIFSLIIGNVNIYNLNQGLSNQLNTFGNNLRDNNDKKLYDRLDYLSDITFDSKITDAFSNIDLSLKQIADKCENKPFSSFFRGLYPKRDSGSKLSEIIKNIEVNVKDSNLSNMLFGMYNNHLELDCKNWIIGLINHQFDSDFMKNLVELMFNIVRLNHKHELPKSNEFQDMIVKKTKFDVIKIDSVIFKKYIIEILIKNVIGGEVTLEDELTSVLENKVSVKRTRCRYITMLIMFFLALFILPLMTTYIIKKM